MPNPTTRTLALADEDDLLVTVDEADLRAVLRLALDTLLDLSDEDRALYDLSLKEAVRLSEVAASLILATGVDS